MKTLTEATFTGVWKSFKTFHPTGAVSLSKEDHYSEFEVEHQEHLMIRKYVKGEKREVAASKAWEVVFQNKKFFLRIPEENLVYEVVTLNHTVMVLLDSSTHQKIFFAKAENWRSFLNSNHQPPL